MITYVGLFAFMYFSNYLKCKRESLFFNEMEFYTNRNKGGLGSIVLINAFKSRWEVSWKKKQRLSADLNGYFSTWVRSGWFYILIFFGISTTLPFNGVYHFWGRLMMYNCNLFHSHILTAFTVRLFSKLSAFNRFSVRCIYDPRENIGTLWVCEGFQGGKTC